MDENLTYILSLSTIMLTKEEEYALFTQLVKARKVIEKLEEKKKRSSHEASQLGIARRIIRQLRSRAMTANIPLVVSMSKRTWVTNLSRDELISEGIVKILNCIDKFDPKLGYKFSTYASRALFNIFNRSGHVESKQHKNRLPSEAMNDISVCSFDVELTNDLMSLKQVLENNYAELNEMEAMVIKELYGEKPKTIHEVGLLVGLTKGRVQQIKAKALVKLREVME